MKNRVMGWFAAVLVGGIAAGAGICSGGAVSQSRVDALVGSGLTYTSRSSAAPIAVYLPNGIYSDSRLKTDVRAMTNALSVVQSLRGVTFRWDAGQFKDRKVPASRQLGFIAQETQRVLPEVVSTDENGYLNVQYSNVVPVLVEAIKEQQKQLDAKDAAIEKLRTDADEAVRDLQTRLADVEDALIRLMSANQSAYPLGQRIQIAPGLWRQY